MENKKPRTLNVEVIHIPLAFTYAACCIGPITPDVFKAALLLGNRSWVEWVEWNDDFDPANCRTSFSSRGLKEVLKNANKMLEHAKKKCIHFWGSGRKGMRSQVLLWSSWPILSNKIVLKFCATLLQGYGKYYHLAHRPLKLTKGVYDLAAGLKPKVPRGKAYFALLTSR